nr:kelch repeat-containing protein At3g27220-like [Tanacetum cinerariifolium]
LCFRCASGWVNCVLRISGLYTSRLLDAACKKVLNLLKKCTRETFSCYKGPYDLSYVVLIIKGYAGKTIGCTSLDKRGKGKLIQKLLLNQKCMGYLVRAYYSISSTRYYKDESFWNADVKSKTHKTSSAIEASWELLFLIIMYLLRIYSVYTTTTHYNWVRDNNDLVTLNPHLFNHTTDKIAELKDKKDKIPETLLSGTFADLPAPETEWEEMAPAPVPRLDGASIQINELFYVFSGYRTLDQVHSHVDVYNFTSNQWGQSFATPKQMANSHLGMATDGRYIYVVSGQQGPQCRTPPVAETFVLDTQTRTWDSFPPLPEPRYAPATQLWRGRLHVMGGGKENRHTPSTDHWSVAVKNGKALEKTWRKEVPIPRGGPHR